LQFSAIKITNGPLLVLTRMNCEVKKELPVIKLAELAAFERARGMN
jgi:hypothetical protein